VQDRFATVFASQENRDASAEGRLELWGIAWHLIERAPVLGVGPNQYTRYSEQVFGRAKEAHSLWLETAAELGLPALAALGSFYLFTVLRTRPLLGLSDEERNGWLRTAACIALSAIPAFVVMAQFVTVTGVEIPYYIASLGAGAVKLHITSSRTVMFSPRYRLERRTAFSHRSASHE
jgi:hypothetical protein